MNWALDALSCGVLSGLHQSLVHGLSSQRLGTQRWNWHLGRSAYRKRIPRLMRTQTVARESSLGLHSPQGNMEEHRARSTGGDRAWPLVPLEALYGEVTPVTTPTAGHLIKNRDSLSCLVFPCASLSGELVTNSNM